MGNLHQPSEESTNALKRHEQQKLGLCPHVGVNFLLCGLFYLFLLMWAFLLWFHFQDYLKYEKKKKSFQALEHATSCFVH